MIFVAFSAANAASVISLPRISIDLDGISISGLSSGADFAAQFQVAYSGILRGSGVFAGQPWLCAVTRFPDDIQIPVCEHVTHRDQCTTDFPAPSVPLCNGCDEGATLHYDHCKNNVAWVRPSLLAEQAHKAAELGLIDPVENLKKAKIYLYRGTKDATYKNGSVANVGILLQALGVPAENILFNNSIPSAHSWPTASYGSKCGAGVIENCGYDGPGDCLSHIYATDAPGASPLVRPTSADAWNRSALYEYDQTPYWSTDNNGTAVYNATTPRATGLAATGYVYVPRRCWQNQSYSGRGCRLHLSLHGCGVNGYYDEAVQHLGFEAWAESNDMVVLYPRIQPHGFTIETKSGCWDAYGQSGPDYALKTGVQMKAIRDMISAISGI